MPTTAWMQWGALGVLAMVLWFGMRWLQAEMRAQRIDATAQRKELREHFLSAVEAQTITLRQGLHEIAEEVREHGRREEALMADLVTSARANTLRSVQ